MSKCVFCQIVAGKAQAQIVYEDDWVVAFPDINPQAPTHILIIPKRHIAYLADTTQEDTALLGRLLAAARHIAQERDIAGGYRLVINNGRQAGQSVFHLHMHLLGGRAMGWPPG